MNNKRHLANIRLGWFGVLTLLFLPWLAGCANDLPPKPPIKLPFEVQKAGSRAETEMRIVERRNYIFYLQFSYKKGDQEDRARVRKLLGDNHKDGIGRWVDTGIPTPLKFKISIIDVTGERQMFDLDIPPMGIISWGADSFGKLFFSMTLKPGLYRVSVESMQDAPEIVGTTVTFEVGFNSKL
jgi:hypothetical protein